MSNNSPHTHVASLGESSAHALNGEVWLSYVAESQPERSTRTLDSGLYVGCGIANVRSVSKYGDIFQAQGATFTVSLFESPEEFDTYSAGGTMRCAGIHVQLDGLEGETAALADSVRSQDERLMQKATPLFTDLALRATTPLPEVYGAVACDLVLEARGLELLAAAHSVFVAPLVGKLSPRHLRIARDAGSYIEQNLDQKLTISSLGRIVGSSPRILTEAFRRAHGETVAAYITRRRMERAAGLLNEGQSVAEVARNVNYSPNGLSSAFRHHFGMSPSAVCRQ
ncbi:MAG: AraC family transcriptional regulator [Pseudomonadota bacterium]